jgi:uncharacterized protein YerC
MNNLDIIKEAYKPYKYTIKGKSIIIETTLGKFVVKENKNNLKELFSYLSSRGFDNYPQIINNLRDDSLLYEYIDDIETPKEQKSIDLISLVSNLHHKTNYYKEVSEDKYQEIFDNIDSNIEYLNDYYNDLFSSYFKGIYHSPSQILFLNNFFQVQNALNFCKNELKEWFELVKKETRQRVAVIHNNLSLSHLIKNNQDYLISWDNYKVDTPVLDIVNFYKNNFYDLDFKSIIDTYFDHFPLNESEKKLFFILINLPPKIEFKANEFNNTKNLREKLDYIFKTEKLTRPYYSTQEVKE